MTAFAALTLPDGQATPVNHTFTPLQKTADGVALWADVSGGIALGFPALSLLLRYPTKANRKYRLSLKIVNPVLDITSPSTSTGIQPAPSKAHEPLCTIEFNFDERATLAQRNDLHAYVKALLTSTPVVNAIQSFQGVV